MQEQSLLPCVFLKEDNQIHFSFCPWLWGCNLYTCCFTTLRPLHAVYYFALRFITGGNCGTHHCVLYKKFGRPSPSVTKYHHLYLFIHKALLHKLPFYLTSLLVSKDMPYQTSFHDCFQVPQICLGKNALTF